MKTRLSKGETHHLVSQAVIKFEKEIMSGYSDEFTTLIFEDTIIVRFKGKRDLSQPPRQKSSKTEADCYKKQDRQEILDSARPLLVTLVEQIIGCTVKTVHSDICITNDERVYVFTLSELVEW